MIKMHLTFAGSDNLITSIILGRYGLISSPTATAIRPTVVKAVLRSFSRPRKFDSRYCIDIFKCLPWKKEHIYVSIRNVQ
jgi:hypothetical protein